MMDVEMRTGVFDSPAMLRNEYKKSNGSLTPFANIF